MDFLVSQFAHVFFGFQQQKHRPLEEEYNSDFEDDKDVIKIEIEWCNG
jgi:hypothetical protein